MQPKDPESKVHDPTATSSCSDPAQPQAIVDVAIFSTAKSRPVSQAECCFRKEDSIVVLDHKCSILVIDDNCFHLRLLYSIHLV